MRNKAGMNALAFTCEGGHLETLKTLLNFKVKVNMASGPNRFSPLLWASAKGYYEMAEWLLENKGRVIGKDKYKRCPLVLAVKNGHTKLASLLL